MAIQVKTQTVGGCAVRHNDTVTIAQDFVTASVGIKTGYRVTLHSKPKYLFLVDARSVDEAQMAVVACFRQEGIEIKSTGATIQKF